ncbi:hypothetical protein HNP33_002931 [Comamonas odontotermitis]|uniref:Uncharacterized protein n=1 Tax=Comamonas odontotermitis TaxID=379895 RepID=A0ABR6RIF8_9BURK|nr:hypothetical protein [Comamonas odontotermitis]
MWPRVLGLGDRMATDALGALIKRGLLKSDSSQGKVRFGMPQHALRFLFPKLWPEAEVDAGHDLLARQKAAAMHPIHPLRALRGSPVQ